MLPNSMKAVRFEEHDYPSVLKCVDAPLPEMGPDEALIRVSATGVTTSDTRRRRHGYNPPRGQPGLPQPFQLGREAAGEVAAVGERVTRVKPGDTIVAMSSPACGNCAYCRRGLEYLCANAPPPGPRRFGWNAEYIVLGNPK